LPRKSDGSNRRRHKQNKRLTNIGCWNIQGLNTKEEEVFKELHRYNINIAVLSETKKKGQGNNYKNEYLYFWSGVEKSKRAKAGVAIAIKKNLEKTITDWSPIDERIITVDLLIKGRSIKIFGIYAPTDDSDMNTKDKFFDKLSEEINKTKSRQEIILLGDLNGRVGRALNNKIIGQHGEDVINDNGMRWIEICEQHSLKILNGFFQHKDINKYTWIQKTRNLRSIIDYILIKQDTSIRPYDVKVWRGAECGSDHLLVKAPVEIKYNKHHSSQEQNNKGKITKQYNIDSLKNESTSFLYKQRLTQKINENIDGTAEEMYETLKKKIHEAALEALGTKEKTKYNNSWWSEDLTELIEEKKQLYLKWLTTKDNEDRKNYNRQKYIVKKETKRMKNTAWENKCAEINSLIGGSRSREAWRTINSLRNNTKEKRKINPIKIEKWKDYYNNLLKEQRRDYINTQTDANETESNEVETIQLEEIIKALRKMKNNKAPGPGDLPIELIKHATTRVLELFCIIFNKCLTGDSIPKEWKISHIMSIYKKGNRNECSNYRGISITSSTGKLYERVLNYRIEREAVEIEEQNGFRSGRSCVDNIFTLKQLIEKKLARNLEIHMTFIDLRKAFDSVPLQKLWTAMKEAGTSNVYINAVKALYRDNQAAIKVGNQISETFTQTKGVKQGSCLSPTLFKIYLNNALKQWTRKCSPMGIWLEDSPIHTILFADDQVVFAEDQQDMTYMLNKLIEEYRKWGLEVNTDKTQYMNIGGTGQDIETESGIIKHVDQYEYLGVTIHHDGRDNKDIMKKIGKGKNMIKALHSILWSRNVTKRNKRNIYQAMIQPVVTYGSEVWVISKDMSRKLLSTEMMCWRRCLGLTLLDRVRNETIRERMNAQITIMDYIGEKQLKWYGHLRRMNEERIPLKVWNWTPTQRNKRGRPQKKWITDVKIEMESRGLREGDWNDKKTWRQGCEKRQN